MTVTLEQLAADVEALKAELRALKDEVQPVVDSHKPDPEWMRKARPGRLPENYPPPSRAGGV